MALEAQAAIVAWYIEQMAVLREQVATAQQQAFTANGDYSDATAQAYVDTIVPVMAGAQAAAAQLTAAYLAYMVADMTGQALGSVVPSPVDLAKVTGAALRNGLSQEVLYRRPFQQVFNELAKPKPPTPSAPSAPSVPRSVPAPRAPEPAPQVDRKPNQDQQRATPQPETNREKGIAAGERRAQTIGLTDLQLAANHTARDILSANQSVVGYRRALTGAENCGMCVVAATRLYYTRNLMPIHPNCDCVVVPVMKGEDPGQTINNKLIGADVVPSAFNKHGVPIFNADQAIDLGDLLQETHDAINARFGASFRDAKGIDYRKVITVHQHGELGPVLTVARHKFTKRQIRQGDLSAR